MAFWLMKSEPDIFGIDHLAHRPNQTEPWDGVRNFQARNMLRDGMQIGDRALFYHSSCNPPGVAGIVRIVRGGYPDPTAFDPASKYFDPKSDPQKPRWYMVDVKLERKLKRLIPIDELKETPGLEGMALLRRGNRLSVMPVSDEEWEIILGLE